MGTGQKVIPPPPEGFVLDKPGQDWRTIPPPPKGFVLDKPGYGRRIIPPPPEGFVLDKPSVPPPAPVARQAAPDNRRKFSIGDFLSDYSEGTLREAKRGAEQFNVGGSKLIRGNPLGLFGMLGGALNTFTSPLSGVTEAATVQAAGPEFREAGQVGGKFLQDVASSLVPLPIKTQKALDPRSLKHVRPTGGLAMPDEAASVAEVAAKPKAMIAAKADLPGLPHDAEYVETVLSAAGRGKPGFSRSKLGDDSVFAYRDPDGLPVAAAVVRKDGTIKDIAKTPGMLGSRGTIKIAEELKTIGAKRPASIYESPQAQQLAAKMEARATTKLPAIKEPQAGPPQLRAIEVPAQPGQQIPAQTGDEVAAIRTGDDIYYGPGQSPHTVPWEALGPEKQKAIATGQLRFESGKYNRVTGEWSGDYTSGKVNLPAAAPGRVAEVASSAGAAASPEQKLTQLLEAIKPLSGKQQKLYTAERVKRAGEIAAIGQTGKGQAGYFQKKGALKGELPKVTFEPPRLEQADVDGLFDKIESSSLRPYDKVSAQDGMMKILTGNVPATSERVFLGQVFGKPVADQLTNMATFGTGEHAQKIIEVAGLSRTLITAFDLSAPFFQGIIAGTRHPALFGKSFVKMFKYAGSQRAMNGLNESIQASKYFGSMDRGGLAMTSMAGTGKLSLREEQLISAALGEKIPIVGRGVAASNRAYTGFLTKFRADIFEHLAKKAEQNGTLTPEWERGTASMINNITGRGELPGGLEGVADLLAATFFSPRLLASRINLVNPAYYKSLPPEIRKELAKTMVSFTTTGLGLLGVAAAAGLKTETDPRSADFGKIKIGNTRYDLWAGFGPFARLTARLITGETKSSTTGRVKKLRRSMALSSFAETKLAPVPALATRTLKGKLGTAGEEITEIITPLVARDINDAIQEYGVTVGAVRGAPSVIGVRTATYGREKKRPNVFKWLEQ